MSLMNRVVYASKESQVVISYMLNFEYVVVCYSQLAPDYMK
jgi:hypothetical protein